MKRLFHFLSLSFIFMLSSMAVCGCVPAQTPLYYFHAGLSTDHALLDDVLGKRSEVDLFSSAADSSAPTTCLLLQMMKQQTFKLFTLAYKVFRALFHSLLPSVLIMSAI